MSLLPFLLYRCLLKTVDIVVVAAPFAVVAIAVLVAAAVFAFAAVDGADAWGVFIVFSAAVDFGVAAVACLSCCFTAGAIVYDEFITVVEVSSVTKVDTAVATLQGMLALCCDCCHH